MAEYTRDEAVAWAKENMRGRIFPPICLPETPDGVIDEAGLRHNVRHCLDVCRSGGLYINGFYSHWWLQTIEERKRVIEIVTDEVKNDDVVIICRCAHQGLQETIELVKHAESAGAHIISLLPPFFGHGGAGASQVVQNYFAAVAQETNLGLSIFNTRRTGYVLSPEELAHLGEIPNVVALKNTEPLAHTMKVRELAGDDVIVVDPSESNFLINMLHFGQNFIYTPTSFLADSAKSQPLRAYMDAGLQGDAARAAKGFSEMEPIRELIRTGIRDPFEATGHPPVAATKLWTEQLGMKGGRVRPPLPDLTSEEKDALLADLDAVGLRIAG